MEPAHTDDSLHYFHKASLLPLQHLQKALKREEALLSKIAAVDMRLFLQKESSRKPRIVFESGDDYSFLDFEAARRDEMRAWDSTSP